MQEITSTKDASAGVKDRGNAQGEYRNGFALQG
jgi:hypothetical protein